MAKLHLQQTGENQGTFVPCHALYKCRNGGMHVTSKTLDNLKKWYAYNRKSYFITDGVRETHLTRFLKENPTGQFAPPESYEQLELPDSTFLPENRIRRGINDPDKPSELLRQLDLEGEEFRHFITEEEQFSLRTYSGHAFSNINGYNREGRAGVEKQLRKHYTSGILAFNEETFSEYEGYAKRDVAAIDAIFARYVRPNNNNRVLYRVVRPPEGKAYKGAKDYVQNTYKIGDTITDKSYMSTTADSDYVLAYGGFEPENVIVYEILTNKGIPIHNPKTYPGQVEHSEREILLNRGSKFKIVNITETKYKTTYPEGKPAGHSAYSDAIPEYKYTVIQMIEEN